MIPINHGNLRDCLIACLIAAGVLGPYSALSGRNARDNSCGAPASPNLLQYGQAQDDFAAFINTGAGYTNFATIANTFLAYGSIRVCGAPDHGIVTIVSVNSRAQR